MARRTNKYQRPFRELQIGATGEERTDGRWIVRTISGAAAVKAYRCPGCHQVIAPRTPHVVAWPAEPGIGVTGTVEERRHWHTGCWRSGPR